MNKRLTDEERSEWGSILMLLHSSCEDTDVTVDGDDLCALIESEKEGWTEAEKWRIEAMKQCPTPDAYDAACKALWKHREEVERLKWDIRGLKYRQKVHKDIAAQLHKQLQDALNTLEMFADPDNWFVVNREDFKGHVPWAWLETMNPMSIAGLTIHRIQEGTANGISKG
ncbi:hypothetical protein [Paenibacillus apiarius]|uniref:hypothetical protein n=1 Tax=Paenibacillus apiarius TaxID=46240 RepID=UPI003B3B8683